MLQFFAYSPPALFFVHTLVSARSGSLIFQTSVPSPSSTHLLLDNAARFCMLFIPRHYLMFPIFTLSQLALFLLHALVSARSGVSILEDVFCLNRIFCALGLPTCAELLLCCSHSAYSH